MTKTEQRQVGVGGGGAGWRRTGDSEKMEVFETDYQL